MAAVWIADQAQLGMSGERVRDWANRDGYTEYGYSARRVGGSGQWTVPEVRQAGDYCAGRYGNVVYGVILRGW